VSSGFPSGDGAARRAGVPRISATTAELTARARAMITPGARRLLGIAGAPGAGKSTLADRLASALGPRLATVVPMDGFHLRHSELVQLGRAQRKGAPDTFDPHGFAALLRDIRAGAGTVVRAPAFDRVHDDPVDGAILVDRDIPLVITEGNYLLLPDGGWPAARRQLDQVWFLELPDSDRLPRLIERHQRFGKAADAARLWATSSDQANADLVLDTRERADLIVTLLD